MLRKNKKKKISDVPAQTLAEPQTDTGPKLNLTCESLFHLILRNKAQSDNAIKKFRKLYSRETKSPNFYSQYLDHWTLKAGFEILREYYHGDRFTDYSELVDPGISPQDRLKMLDHWLKRLSLESQWVLFAHDRFDIEYSLIAASTGKSVDNVKLIRTQALQDLEHWVWNQN